MKHTAAQHCVLIMCLAVLSGCGHYPTQINSARDLKKASVDENIINMHALPLPDWPKLEKFTKLEHFYIAQWRTPDISDIHIRTLAGLNLPKLRDININDCTNVTGLAILSLTNLPSLALLGVRGTQITDRDLGLLIHNVPALSSLNIEGCKLLSPSGFMQLTNAPSLKELSFSVDKLDQKDVEQLIRDASTVTWWGISDRTKKLSLYPLSQLQHKRGITVVIFEGNVGRGIDDVIASGNKTEISN